MDQPFPSERAEHAEFEALVSNLCARPGMYVAEPTIAAVVAYLVGYDDALHGAPLLGFHQWLVVRGDIGNNQHWAAVAIGHSEIPALRALLEEYFTYRRRHGITKVFYEYGKWLLGKKWYRGPLRKQTVASRRARKTTHK